MNGAGEQYVVEHDRELQRQEALESYGIIGSEAEEFYNRIVTLAAAVCDCPIALVSFIDNDRQWFKAAFGLEVTETPREVSFCAHAVQMGQMLVVEDALRDPRFVDNALVVGSPYIRFYAGEVFFASNGVPLGTLCVIDRRPRQLSASQAQALATLAREVELQLALRRSLVSAERASDQKSRLAAMLSHDLRSPLQVATFRASELAMRYATTPESRLALSDLEWALQSMQRMTVDMLDVCAAEAGQLQVRPSHVALAALIAEIESSARIAAGTHHCVEVVTEFERAVIETDRDLIKRIADNLVANAIKYSPPKAAVRLEVTSRKDGTLSMRVADQGPGIPEAEREAIFDIYERLDRDRDRHARASYGLGLAFCRLAAQALEGRVWAESRPQGGAVFCLELPPRRTRAPAPALTG